MQIKRLRLSGFKSFVEPAELGIEPGLTGIVGPNGCGKSNILEAIRWVMGESSPKSMRGAGMDDVIFAGTAARPARDFAEVTMLIERPPAEEASVAPQGGEVEVTRRIERGAGSAYRVNGRDVRARDIALLFADAATGAHSPALVSQNRIGAIIAAKPTERRAMLEEAAGIAGLHVRRKDAEQKLRAAEANLARLDELLGDMEQRSAALKRQARAAERYRKLTAQIRDAEARLLFARWREAAAAADSAKQEAERADAAVAASLAAQRNATADQTKAAEALENLRIASQAAREKAAALGHRRASLQAEQDGLGRRIADLAAQEKALITDREREAALGQDAQSAIARLEREVVAIAARIAAAEAGRGTIDQRLMQLENAAREAGAALAQARAEQAGEQAEARLALAALETARDKLGRVETDKLRLEDHMRELGESAPLIETRLAARQKLETAAEQLTGAAEALGAAETARQQASLARDAAESEGAAMRAALAALQSEAQSLRTATEGASGDRAIDHIEAHPGYERALAAALGDDLEAGLSSDAPRRWAGADKSVNDPALPPGCTPLGDHVTAPAALARRLSQIGVTDKDDGSIALAVGQRLVTKDGRLRRWDGYIATGLGAAAAERLIRINRLSEIERALPAASAAVEKAEAQIEAARKEIEAAREASEAARVEEACANAAIRDAEREEGAANIALERLDVRRASLAERIAQIEEDHALASAAVKQAEARMAALPDSAATETRVAALLEAAETAQNVLAETRAEAATLNRSIEADQQRRETADQEKADWQIRAKEAVLRAAAIEQRLVETRKEAQELTDAPPRLAADIAQLDSDLANVSSEAEAALERLQQAEAGLRETEARLAELGEALSIAREARAGASARHENQENRRVEMVHISRERFECLPEQLPEAAGFDAADTRQTEAETTILERLTSERERIGPVNLIAEQELAELEDSRIHNQNEREELGLAINRLRGSIGSLNREGRARLLLAFEEVDRHFRSLFTTLFEGGQAHLALIESDDPLEAGLEIMAQPPGKKLAALTLLSGGEQALTAIALIFALFLTNPAPICVLDEVDAPLDDANIERFCALLDRMTGETDTRYLIVTHNAVTMSRMHRLFGVTMIEKGVSKLVSVDLGGAEQLLAAE